MATSDNETSREKENTCRSGALHSPTKQAGGNDCQRTTHQKGRPTSAARCAAVAQDRRPGDRYSARRLPQDLHQIRLAKGRPDGAEHEAKNDVIRRAWNAELPADQVVVNGRFSPGHARFSPAMNRSEAITVTVTTTTFWATLTILGRLTHGFLSL
jgi:hypothetical protein